MATFQLAPLDAKLIYLTLQYHLARPGSELDSNTNQPTAHGLREVAEALKPQLERAVATIELNEDQHQRLLSAISGTMNELKTYPLLPKRGAGRHSAIPDFDVALRELFPEVEEDPEEAVQLAGHLMALRRRLGVTPTAAPEPSPTRGRWWRFWGRKGA